MKLVIAGDCERKKGENIASLIHIILLSVPHMGRQRELYVRAGSSRLPRFRATVAYDGTDFEGWQTQPSGRTVQDALESRLSKMLSVPVQIAGSGRTDAGVHARGQCFHFELPEGARCPGVLPPALDVCDGVWHDAAAAALERALSGLSENTGLPPSIQVLTVAPAAPDFHAKESRVGARYSYSVVEGSGCPLSARYRWAIGRRTLDVARMAEAAALLRGEHDFTALAFRRPDDPRTPIKRMRTLDVHRDGAAPGEGIVTIVAECDRFLQHMMRIIAGTLVHVGLGRLSVADVAHLLVSANRASTPHLQVCKAPAHGLCLERCFYDEPPGGWLPPAGLTPMAPGLAPAAPASLSPAPSDELARDELAASACALGTASARPCRAIRVAPAAKAVGSEGSGTTRAAGQRVATTYVRADEARRRELRRRLIAN